MTENQATVDMTASSDESEDEIDKVTMVKGPSNTEAKPPPVIMDEVRGILSR